MMLSFVFLTEVLPDVAPLRKAEPKEDNMVSEFQRQLVDLAKALNVISP